MNLHNTFLNQVGLNNGKIGDKSGIKLKWLNIIVCSIIQIATFTPRNKLKSI